MSFVAETKSKLDAGITPERKTLVYALLDQEDDKEWRPSVRDVTDEMMIITSAATDTTTAAMTIITLNLLADDEMRDTLMGELTEAYPDPTTPIKWAELERLPFFQAVMKEALRFVAPDIQCKDVVEPETRD